MSCGADMYVVIACKEDATKIGQKLSITDVVIGEKSVLIKVEGSEAPDPVT